MRQVLGFVVLSLGLLLVLPLLLVLRWIVRVAA